MISILIVLAALFIVCFREVKRSSMWYGDTPYRPLLDESNIHLQPRKSEVYGSSIIKDSLWAIILCAVSIWALT